MSQINDYYCRMYEAYSQGGQCHAMKSMPSYYDVVQHIPVFTMLLCFNSIIISIKLGIIYVHAWLYMHG